MYESGTQNPHQAAGCSFTYLHILKWKREPSKQQMLIPNEAGNSLIHPNYCSSEVAVHHSGVLDGLRHMGRNKKDSTAVKSHQDVTQLNTKKGLMSQKCKPTVALM